VSKAIGGDVQSVIGEKREQQQTKVYAYSILNPSINCRSEREEPAEWLLQPACGQTRCDPHRGKSIFLSRLFETWDSWRIGLSDVRAISCLASACWPSNALMFLGSQCYPARSLMTPGLDGFAGGIRYCNNGPDLDDIFQEAACVWRVNVSVARQID